MTPALHCLLSEVQPGGVILFARNLTSANQTWHLLRDCQACCREPLFFCVDMEGGKVDRLKQIFGPAPSAAEVFATGDKRIQRKHGRIIGECCRALGFNVDFAPVVDLALPASSKVMASRVVSPDPVQTSGYAREFLAGLKAARVLGCTKHFPGLGEASLDTHQELPTVRKPWSRMWTEDLLPYRKLVRESPFIMVAHANYTAVRDSVPASLSKKWISGIMREKLKYRGLVICDDLEMGGVLAAAPPEEAAVRHIRAGGDLCLVCHQEDFVRRAFEGLHATAAKDRRFQTIVQQRIQRVLAYKSKTAAVAGRYPKPGSRKIAQLSRALWEFAEQVRYSSEQPEQEA